MRVYHDEDADLTLLEGQQIGVVGYGNQGRAQALNLRDSGLDVLVGNRQDSYADQAEADGFAVLPIEQAVAAADVVMLLIPDEVMPEAFDRQIAPRLGPGKTLVFASGYTIAFGLLNPPGDLDVVLVAPRMIGAGVRDLYVEGQGFPAFISVAQDHSGQAKALALALAKGIGATRRGVVEVTFAQEAELDLFTEQCFGPAFGHVLTTAVNLLLDEGYPPEAVLLELYMSGEFSYTLAKIAELGLVEQTALHSRTSQYGSMSRGMRFILPELRSKMEEGLVEIRSGQFAQEWAAEQAAGAPTLDMLQQAARSLPLHQQEMKLRQALRGSPLTARILESELAEPPNEQASMTVESPTSPGIKPLHKMESRAHAVEWENTGGLGQWLASLLGRGRSGSRRGETGSLGVALVDDEWEEVLRRFLARAARDPGLRAFAQRHTLTSHYVLSDPEIEFFLRFRGGVVAGGLGAPPDPAEVRLEMAADVLDGMFTGQVNAMRAAMTGQLVFGGDARLAMSQQQIQKELSGLYVQAREDVLADR